MNDNLKKIILIASDFAILYLSLFLSLFFRYGNDLSKETWEKHLSPFSFLFLVWIIIFYIFNLYSLKSLQNKKSFYRSINRSLTLAVFIAISFFYLNQNIGIAPKTNLFIFISVFYFLFFIWRYSFNKLLENILPNNKIVLVGLNKQTKEIINILEENPSLGFKVSFILNDTQEAYKNYTIKTDISTLKNYIKNSSSNTIVISKEYENSQELRQELFASLSLGVSVINLENFYELITGKVPLESLNQTWFLENLNEGAKKTFDDLKRLFDFVFALLILLLSFPFWPLIGIAIKIDSPGLMFFKQTRLGKNKKEFKIIKFRTMKNTNNNYSPTTNKDPRISKLGSFLRKSRIDEIPQVLNIIKGDMSFVGPRPERPEIADKLRINIPFYDERMLIKPGLTGWDQISGEYHSPNQADTIKKLQSDLFYIKNRSIYLDLSIILKTIAVVFSRAGL